MDEGGEPGAIQRRMHAGTRSSGATWRTQVWSVRLAAAGAAAASSYIDRAHVAAVPLRHVLLAIAMMRNT